MVLNDQDELPLCGNNIPKVKSGDFIVFPSHYPHYVTTHKGKHKNYRNQNYTTKNMGRFGFKLAQGPFP